MNHDDFSNHQLLAIWAADCAEHVIGAFTQVQSDDARPLEAIAAARDWVRGELRVHEARTAAFAAHAAARETANPAATFAARAAGHAAATAHVSDHAKHAAAYARKAVDKVDAERQWQRERLPLHLHSDADLN